jgi:NAD(P)-dependent dehydrogenase (short-subunit alcohol dehydrogenase family)
MQRSVTVVVDVWLRAAATTWRQPTGVMPVPAPCGPACPPAVTAYAVAAPINTVVAANAGRIRPGCRALSVRERRLGRVDIGGHVAVVTGAAVGIGRAIAQSVAAAGAVTVVADIDAAELARTAELIRASGGAAVDVAADVTDTGAVEQLIATATGLGVGVRVLVNNAGGVTGPVWPEAGAERWRTVVDLNMCAAMHVTQLALPALQHHGGAVVNIASTAGLGFDAAASPEYAAAKAGLIRFTTAVRQPGVRINAVAPDWIHTPRAERELAAMTPAERAAAPGWIEMRDVCDEVLRLLRDDTLDGQVVVLRPQPRT